MHASLLSFARETPRGLHPMPVLTQSAFSMQVFGLTGGIGCGKSTVAAHFAARGVSIIDADQVARDVVAPETEGLAEVVARFGAEFLAADGTLDRKRLGAHVFAQPELRRALESIVIPRIAAESMRRFQSLGEQGARWGLYEAALLVEQKTDRAMAGLMVVTVHPAVQQARVAARDGLSQEDARARMNAQLPLVQKVQRAHWVVDNSSSVSRLRERVADLYTAIVIAHGAPWPPSVSFAQRAS
ncbi:MAG: dephospho-CoA kinase [Deltaproteobacteria bacterium]|nr:dephospho-CoA kinase [Deltaproteobacteria bacterium]